MVKNKRKFAWTGTFLVTIGILFLSYNYSQEKKFIAYEYMDSKLLASSLSEVTENKTAVATEEATPAAAIQENTTVTNHNVPNYYYIGYLEIPKIDLRKGFVDMSSQDNNVEKNIMVIPSSSYPDVDRGNLIIAGHSGIGYKAFFDRLQELSLTDRVIVTYQNTKYTYEIADIYQQEKNGRIAVRRDYRKNTLTLVTCTNGTNDRQTVYIAYLVDKQAI